MRVEVGAAAVEGVIYVAGGLDENRASLSAFEAFDTATRTWSTLGPLPSGRDHFGFAALNGKLYLSGGETLSAGAVHQGMWVYDPVTGAWGTLAPMPASRSQHGMVAVEGKLYVVGGIAVGESSASVWAYDPASGEWQTDLARIPTERNHLAVVEGGGRIFAIGGLVNDQGSTAVEAYDPSTDTWEPLMPLPTARDGGAAAAFLDGRVHVVGGADFLSGETHPEHEIYDAASRTWTNGPDLPTPRQSMGSVVVDGRWYTIDGAQLATISVSNVVEVLVP